MCAVKAIKSSELKKFLEVLPLGLFTKELLKDAIAKYCLARTTAEDVLPILQIFYQRAFEQQDFMDDREKQAKGQLTELVALQLNQWLSINILGKVAPLQYSFNMWDDVLKSWPNYKPMLIETLKR
jgi:hypothetical protein